MFLKKVALHQYRNYEQLEIDIRSNVNIFVGLNAQGKTNLLESIYVLALTKSHRTHQDKELIRWNHERAVLHGVFEKKYGTYQLDLAISHQGKKAKINGLEQKKLSNYVGTMNVVLFAPEDLEIVKGAPGVRRRFMDMEIGQIYPSYLYDLSQFQKILLQRNHFLKKWAQTSSTGSMLEVWNEQFIRSGIKIMKKRQSFIKKLQKWAEKIHANLTGGGETLRIRYQPSFAAEQFEDETVLTDQFMLKLSQIKDLEIKRGVSLIGPHRDDLLFYINDKRVDTFGSQGQQRTTALSLKLAEIELIYDEVGEYPILLLDDVLSELDQFRQTHLIETFQDKVQTFITTTGIEHLQLDRLHDYASTYRISNGALEPENGR